MGPRGMYIRLTLVYYPRNLYSPPYINKTLNFLIPSTLSSFLSSPPTQAPSRHSPISTGGRTISLRRTDSSGVGARVAICAEVDSQARPGARGDASSVAARGGTTPNPQPPHNRR